MSDPYAFEPDPWDDQRQATEGWEGFAEPASPDAPAYPTKDAFPEYVECWRCGKTGLKDSETCVYCRAVLHLDRAPRRLPGRPLAEARSAPVVKVVLAFIALLLSLIVFAAIEMIERPAVLDKEAVRRMLIHMFIFDLVDVVLVIHVWVWIGSPKPLPLSPTNVRWATWVTATPLLLLLLGLNHIYFQLLRNFINLPFVEELDFKAHKDLLGLAIITICVQPAIMEEFFFRYLALNTLKTSMGTTAAVLVSSVMFGMAHIGNPLGMPYLIVAGIVFGYARVGSGSLILPMLMHFGHNLAVILMQ